MSSENRSPEGMSSQSDDDMEEIETVFQAAEIDDQDTVKNYLDKGFDINSVDPCQKTLIHIATEEHNIKLIQLLLDYGADINDYCETEAEQGYAATPLSLAIADGQKRLVKFLLNHGAKIEHEYHGSALSDACYFGHLGIVKLLLKLGANVNYSCDVSNDTILHAAAGGRNEKILKLFIGKLNLEAKGWRGKTPLFQAIGKAGWDSMNVNEKAVELLLDYGASTDVREEESGRTMLHVACDWRRGKDANLLLEYGADINTLDNRGKSALIFAATNFAAVNRKLADCVSEENNCIGVLIRHIAKMISQNFYVSEEDLTFLKSDDKLCSYFIKCKEAVEKLKVEMVKNSTISYYDILIERDLGKLAAYANNENVMRAMVYIAGKRKFSIYATMLRNQVRRGMWRKFLLRKVNRFFVAVAAAEGNEALPRLPITCSDRIFHHLRNVDLRELVKVCDPFNKFKSEIYNMTID